MKLLFSFVLLFTGFACYAQNFDVKDIPEKDIDSQTSNALSSNQIMLVNQTGKSIIVECSINKTSWSKKTLKLRSGIEVYLTSDVGYFYVRLCNTRENETTCDVYRLSPSKKYVVPENDDKLIVKKLDAN